MPTQTHGQLHHQIAKLEERVKEQERVVKTLRRRVVKKGGRKKAPRLFKAYQRRRTELVQMRDELAALKRKDQKLHLPPPLRVKALDVARSLVGVMEEGGNNAGPMVSRIIRENGGTGPEPWCGDFVAYCYRHAGSKRVQRPWAGVPLIRGLAGIRATSHPRPGDLVRFEFTGDNTPDHVGIFVRWIDDHTIETIEGNTGATGAVSDSRTGGDGVYVKHRNVALVKDFLAVLG